MGVIVAKLESLACVSPDTAARLSTHLLLSYQVCELDIIFNFEKAYFILDEFIIGGEIQETSKKSAVKAIEDSDMLQEVSTHFLMPWEKMVVVAGWWWWCFSWHLLTVFFVLGIVSK